MSHLIKTKSSPLCSEWQVAHFRLAPGVMLKEACKPFRALMREAISAWQSRHLNAGFPVEISWTAVQPVMPLRDRWARDRGPGEIWAETGIEIPQPHTTVHSRSFLMARVT